MTGPAIATLTMNPTIDLSYEVEKLLHTQKLRTREETFFPGGGGINVARVLARLGRQAQCVYLAGGITGTTYRALIEAQGLDATCVPIAGSTRITTTVFESETGKEFRFTPPGPEVSETEWRGCLDLFEDLDCDWLVASGSLPPGVPHDFYAILAGLVSRKGTRLVLDTSGSALRAGIDSGSVFLAKPNEAEFEMLVGRNFANNQEVGEAARELVRTSGMHAIVVTLGADGAVMATAEHFESLPATPLDVKSAVGAGDSFVAGMIHSLAAGGDFSAAFRNGMAAGTAAALTPGNNLALREDIERLAAAYRST